MNIGAPITGSPSRPAKSWRQDVCGEGVLADIGCSVMGPARLSVTYCALAGKIAVHGESTSPQPAAQAGMRICAGLAEKYQGLSTIKNSCEKDCPALPAGMIMHR